MRYLANVWYQIAWSDELGHEEVLAREILDLRLALFRDTRGKPKALLDQCPHRFAPLSAGKLSDGTIACGYHGLRFDGNGRCVHNPHGRIGAISATPFAVEERHGALWLWNGRVDEADPDLIPDLSFIDRTPPNARITGYIPTEADYQLVIDNIMDLSHADYLHPDTVGGMFVDASCKVTAHNETVAVRYVAESCEPSPAMRSIVPEPHKADVYVSVDWFPAGIMVLASGANIAGMKHDPGMDTVTLHSITPARAGVCHYFYCSTRPYAQDDEELSAQLKIMLERAFVDEDKPMLELQQANMGHSSFWELQPLLLKIDSGAVQVRRRLEEMIAAQASALQSDQ